MAVRARGLVVFGSLLGTCGCGGDAASIPLADFGARLDDAECARGVRCGTYPDQAACLATRVDRTNQLLADVAAGKTFYDANAAARCVAALQSPTGRGSCSITVQLTAGPPQACLDTFRGTLVDGAACFADEECVSLDCGVGVCAAGALCCAGTCNPTRDPVPMGGDCSMASSRCLDGAFCKVTDTGSSCVARTTPGQPCIDRLECTPGNACNADPLAPGTCAKVPGEGEACAPGVVDCDESGLYFCDPPTLKCVRRVAVGGACSSGAACAAYARCDAATQTCVARGRVDDECADIVDCLSGLTCTTTRCALPPVVQACP